MSSASGASRKGGAAYGCPDCLYSGIDIESNSLLVVSLVTLGICADGLGDGVKQVFLWRSTCRTGKRPYSLRQRALSAYTPSWLSWHDSGRSRDTSDTQLCVGTHPSSAYSLRDCYPHDIGRQGTSEWARWLQGLCAHCTLSPAACSVVTGCRFPSFTPPNKQLQATWPSATSH